MTRYYSPTKNISNQYKLKQSNFQDSRITLESNSESEFDINDNTESTASLPIPSIPSINDLRSPTKSRRDYNHRYQKKSWLQWLSVFIVCITVSTLMFFLGFKVYQHQLKSSHLNSSTQRNTSLNSTILNTVSGTSFDQKTTKPSIKKSKFKLTSTKKPLIKDNSRSSITFPTSPPIKLQDWKSNQFKTNANTPLPVKPINECLEPENTIFLEPFASSNQLLYGRPACYKNSNLLINILFHCTFEKGHERRCTRFCRSDLSNIYNVNECLEDQLLRDRYLDDNSGVSLFNDQTHSVLVVCPRKLSFVPKPSKLPSFWKYHPFAWLTDLFTESNMSDQEIQDRSKLHENFGEKINDNLINKLICKRIPKITDKSFERTDVSISGLVPGGIGFVAR